MRIFMFHLYMLIWCRAAETLTDQLTDLGQKVPIICNLAEKEVYWFLQKFPYSPVLILRSFESDPFYYDTSFKHKYSVNSKHHLIINNVTADELGVYYCMSTSKDPKFSNGTRLSFIEPTLYDCKNYTKVEYTEQNQTSWTIISGLLIAALVIVSIGLLKIYACKNNRSDSSKLQNTDLQPTPAIQQQPRLNQLQNAEVDAPRLCTNNYSLISNSTYVALQLPQPQTQEY